MGAVVRFTDDTMRIEPQRQITGASFRKGFLAEEPVVALKARLWKVLGVAHESRTESKRHDQFLDYRRPGI